MINVAELIVFNTILWWFLIVAYFFGTPCICICMHMCTHRPFADTYTNQHTPICGYGLSTWPNGGLVWHSCNSIFHINKLMLRWAQLVLELVTTFGRSAQWSNYTKITKGDQVKRKSNFSPLPSLPSSTSLPFPLFSLIPTLHPSIPPQGRIQEFVKGGRSPYLSLLFPSPSPLPLKIGPLKTARRSGGAL